MCKMSLTVAFTCLIIIVILVRFIFEKKNQRLYQLLKQFPSHPTYPIIGNAHLLLGPFKGALEKISKIVLPYDRQVYWMGPIPVLLLRKYDDIVIVLSQCQYRDTLGIMNESFGVGLITAKYKEWKTSRRILNRAFSSEMLPKYFQVIRKNATILIGNLKSVADTGEEVDVLHWMAKSSLDSVIENSMGISIEHSGKSGDNFCQALHEICPTIAKRITFPWLLQRHIFRFYLKITGKIKLIEHLYHLPKKILKNNLNKSRNFQVPKVEFDKASSCKTIVDLLVHKCSAEPNFTESRMRDELLQIIVTATETTPVTMSFLLLMLAMNQDVQKKLFEEINQLPTTDGRLTLTQNDLTYNLQYLDRCVKETLRRYSAAILTTRRTHKDISLKDNKIIPANAFVVTFIYYANQDPELYENPLKWDPEHFNEEAVKQTSKSSEITFGCGPRNCIGSRYAIIMIKTIIVHILHEYHLSTSIKELTEKDLYTDMSIRSKLGYPVKFTSRQEAKV